MHWNAKIEIRLRFERDLIKVRDLENKELDEDKNELNLVREQKTKDFNSSEYILRA